MKKLIFFVTIIASTLSVMAQDSLFIYKTGGPIEAKLISNIDSITFSSLQDSMYIHHSGTAVASYATSYVDSISFTHVKKAQSTTTDTGVVINGVRWATRNIAAPGIFTTNTYASGDFYQWNSNVGWPTTGAIGSITATDGSTTWNSSRTTTPSSTDTWTATNDPSPKGWRVPTIAEIDSLVKSTKVTHIWTTQNSVYGEKFTDKTTGNTLFLPAVGARNNLAGKLYEVGSTGYYWSSTTDSGNGAVYGLYFGSSGAVRLNYDCRTGLPVRPVTK